MIFNLQNFTDKLVEEFKDRLSRQEVIELLDLNEQYDKDTPISTGKRLVLNYLMFKGVKSTDNDTYAGDLIDYQQEIFNGVNIWIADNLKGKSSIFKIIKFALTGSNALKPNIKNWIKEIILVFNISGKYYTVYLNTSRRLKGSLFNGAFKSADEITKSGIEPLIDARSELEYNQSIQDFFFKQFSYYPLKWTQKNPVKEKNELLEVGTSWNTYFMSMLLESKNSGDMYGAQGKKIFEMLLGLELTYPINRLKVKADLLNDQKAKEHLFQERLLNTSNARSNTYSDKLKELNSRLAEIEQITKGKTTLSDLYAEYNTALFQIRERTQQINAIDSEVSYSNKQLQVFGDRQLSNHKEIARINREIDKVSKNVNDLKEYLEIGVFFSNLDIKQCPSCDHKISEEKKKDLLTSHKCYVCDHSININEDNEDSEIYKSKINVLEQLIVAYKDEMKQLEGEKRDIDKLITDESKKNETLQIKRANSNTIDRLAESLSLLELRIANEKSANDDEKNKILAEQAVIEYQIDELKNEKIDINDKPNFADQIALLNTALLTLSDLRFSISAKVLERLCKLMLSELHELGLLSVSEIDINSNFDISYKQDGEFITFSQIAEGEQLRAKVALYLSLIQLDIEFNYGRHTRFLIIDSPGSEEADENYLQGLSAILRRIQDRFGDQLQILIGTAERELEGIVERENIFPKKLFVF